MTAALIITLYQDEPVLHQAYRLLKAVIDIDELMTVWRQRHALMVHRMIGVKMGTGGSSGYHYLQEV
jgi:tryptophan 2,3-dioxygenase